VIAGPKTFRIQLVHITNHFDLQVQLCFQDKTPFEDNGNTMYITNTERVMKETTWGNLSREQRNLRLHHYKSHNGELIIYSLSLSLNESVYLDQVLD